MLKHIALVAVAAACWSVPAAAQADPQSANVVMPGCRYVIADDNRRPDLRMFCMGVVRGVWVLLSDLRLVCSPPNATTGQAIRIVVQYVDARPQHHHEDIARLATEALINAWNCPR